MLSKQDFKVLSNDEQATLVNGELLKHKGTKDFGLDEFDFSYSFARKILVDAGYDTFVQECDDGSRVKLFRRLTEEEKEEKQKDIEKIEEMISAQKENTNSRVVQLAIDIRENEKDEEVIRKTFPAFESTWNEFEALLKTEDFKIYEKKYVYDLVLRTFLEKYGDVSE